MTPKVIDIPGVGVVEFPDTMSDDDINAAAKKLYDDAAKGAEAPPQVPSTTVKDVAMAVGKEAAPAAAGYALSMLQTPIIDFATNPKAWRAGKLAGEVVGGLAGAVGGYKYGGFPGGALGLSTGMWSGAKAGWRLTNAAQKVSIPLSKVMDKLGPVVGLISASAAVGRRLNSPESLAELQERFPLTKGDKK